MSFKRKIQKYVFFNLNVYIFIIFLVLKMNTYFDEDVQVNENVQQTNVRFEQYQNFKSFLYEGIEENKHQKNSNNLLAQECQMWKSKFPYLRIIGTAVKQSAPFCSHEDETLNSNIVIDQDYEEIFAEHHDQEKLEKFNSADNLINAIAYHSIIQGKTFRIDSGNVLPENAEPTKTQHRKLNQFDNESNVATLNGRSHKKIGNNDDFPNMEINKTDKDDSNINLFSENHKDDMTTFRNECQNSDFDDNLDCENKNDIIYFPPDDIKHSKGDENMRNHKDISIISSKNNITRKYYSYDSDVKYDTGTGVTESYDDSISSHAIRVRGYDRSKSHVTTDNDNEPDSLTSLKTLMDRPDVEDENESIGDSIEENLSLKHNTAPSVTTMKKPYIQDKGRFIRSFQSNATSTSSRVHKNCTTMNYHKIKHSNNNHSNANNNVSYYNIPLNDSNFTTNVKQHRTMLCRNQYKNSETSPAVKNIALSLNNSQICNMKKTGLFVPKHISVRDNELLITDNSNYSAKNNNFINNFNKLEISKSNDFSKNKLNKRAEYNYYKLRNEETQCIEDIYMTKYANSKYNLESQSEYMRPSDLISCNLSAHGGDSKSMNSKIHNQLQINDSYHNTHKTKHIIDNQNDSRNSYYIDNRKLSDTSHIPNNTFPYSTDFPLNIAIKDIKLERVQKTNLINKRSSRSSTRNKFVDLCQNEKNCFSSRPPTSVSLKTLSPLNSARVMKYGRGNKPSNISIFTNLTTRKVDRSPSLRSKIFGFNNTANNKKKCLSPLEQDLSKPGSSINRNLVNQTNSQYDTSQNFDEIRNPDHKGSSWNLNHFNKIPPIKGAKL